MRPADDDSSVWTTDEDLLAGRREAQEPGLTALVAALRATADAPAPPPSDALRAVLAGTEQPGPTRGGASGSAAARAAARWASSLGMAGKVALGAGLAVASVGAAAAVEGVPDAVQEPAREIVGWVVEAVVPGDQSPAAVRAPAGEQRPGAEVDDDAAPRRSPDEDRAGTVRRAEPEPPTAPSEGRPSDPPGASVTPAAPAAPADPANPADPADPATPGTPPSAPPGQDVAPATPPVTPGDPPATPARPAEPARPVPAVPPAEPGHGVPSAPPAGPRAERPTP